MLRTAAIASLVTLVATFAVAANQPAISTVTLTISGMHCESCASGISAMLKRTDGVVKADVSYDDRQAIVQYDGAKTSAARIIEAIQKLGYKASVKK